MLLSFKVHGESMTENDIEEDIYEYSSLGFTKEDLDNIDFDKLESIIEEQQINLDIDEERFEVDLDLDF